MSTWAENRRMRFDKDKCKVLHFGKRNHTVRRWRLPGLSNTTSKKDLGVIVNHKLNIT